jgi:uncharacterized protein (TIRG00374 family)
MTMPLKSAREDFGKASPVRRWLGKGWRWLPVILAPVLAWHALRGVAWAEAWGLLAGLGPLAILILVAINLFMLPVMTGRWWLLLRTLGVPVGLLAVSAYRCAANAVSYLTPGPHFGGEPLAVYLLHGRQGIALTLATTSVVLDRLLELSASLVVFSLCFTALALRGGPFAVSQQLAMAIVLPAGFAVLLALFFTGGRPLSRFVRRFGRFGKIGFLTDAFSQGEAMAAALFRRHRRQFLLANLLSLGHWLAVFGEFWLMSYFLGFPLSFGHLTAVVLTARLAFLTPLPAGIGVLETALPWLTATLGQGDALGLSLCLIIRFRDLLFGMTGLVLTLKYLTCRGKTGIINNIWG